MTAPTDIGVNNAVVTWLDPVVTDNSGQSLTVVCVPESGSTFPLDVVTTVTCTVTDDAGNSAACDFTVTVVDEEVPAIYCPAPIFTVTDAGQPGAVVTWTVTAQDNSGAEPTIVCVADGGLVSGDEFPIGVTTVTCTATDAASNEASCSFTITVEDEEVPTITCPLDMTAPTDIGVNNAVVTWLDPVVTDNSGQSLTVVCVPESGSTFPLDVVTTVTCTVTDDAGNSAACDFTVTVVDEEVPAIYCPAPIFTVTDAGQPGAVVTWTVTAQDNSGAEPTIVCVADGGLVSGDEFPIGVTTVTCTATDAASNEASCSFTITVEDEEVPTITCPLDMTAPTDIGVNNAVVTWLDPVVTDNSGQSLTVVCVPESGSTFPLDVVTTVTCTVTDDAGNSAACDFTVTVVDEEVPAIYCPAPIFTVTDAGQPGAVVTWTVTAQDNSGAEPTIVCVADGGLVSGDEFPIGVTTVTCTATDAASNEASCSFTITVEDEEDPTITCPLDMTAPTDIGVNNAVVTWVDPVVTDNSGQSLTVVCVPESGSTFPLDVVTTVTCTVTDDAGNSAACDFTVTVVDEEVPAIYCPDPIFTVTDAGQPGAVVTWTVTAQDNSGAEPTIVCVADGGLVSGDEFPIGVTTVTCTATDAASNEASCSFTITVEDEEVPTITCPLDMTAPTDIGVNNAVVTWLDPVVTDNSGQSLTVVCVPESGSTFPLDVVTTVTCTVTDDAGNSAACDFTVTVVDEEVPAIYCPDPIFTVTDAGQPGAVVTWTVTAQDNSGAEPTIVCVADGGLVSGDEFPIGVATVTCTATDAASNEASCSFTITVEDEEVPTITCPLDMTAPTDIGVNNAVVTWLDPVVTDNSGQSLTVVCVPESGSTFPLDVVTTVTCTVTDDAGNSAACDFTVTVVDEEVPAIYCPAPIFTVTDAGQPGAVVTWTVTAQDNSGAEPTIVCVADGGLVSGDEFPIGVTTVTCTATDAASNEASCSFTITVEDEEDPTITCPLDMTAPTDIGVNNAVVTWLDPVVTDNSGQSLTVVCVPESGSTFPLDVVTTVTCTVTDDAGNSAACDFTVTVVDEEVPAIYCPAPIFTVTDAGQPGAVVTWTVTAQDNSGAEPTIVCVADGGLVSGDEFPIGVTTVTCTATDAALNQASCSFTITVEDEEDPTITCPLDMTAPTDIGVNNAVVTWLDPVVTDNSGQSLTVVCVPESGSTFPLDVVTTVTCTVTDDAGNSAACDFTVTVVDEEVPTITCPLDMTAPTDIGVNNAVVTWLDPVVTDNSGQSLPVVCVPESGSTFPLDVVTTVTCTVTDDAGNSAACDFTVTVVDEEVPAIYCPAPIFTVTDAGQPGAVVTWTVTAQDNSGAAPTIVCVADGGLVSGDEFPIGVTTVTCTATDAASNEASCSFTITVEDEEIPNIYCSEDIVVKEDECLNEAVVAFTVTGSDNSGIDPTIVCYPASGYTFPLGTTTVTCTATDGNGNENTCEFTVTVEDKDPCADNQCVNGGICVPDPVDCYKYTCLCNPYYRGEFCERLFHVQLDVQEVTVDVPADALIQDGGVQQVTLDIVFIPTESSADVVNAAGDDRYRIQVFLATDSDGSNPSPSTDADLTPSQQSQDITDLVNNLFDNVDVTLDLSEVSCFEGQFQYICIDLGPSQVALDDEKWDQAPPAIRVGCAPITCKSTVEVNIDIVRIDSPNTLILCDEEVNEVTVSVMATPTTDSSAPINACGVDRYSFTAVLATDDQGSLPVPVPDGVLTVQVKALDLEDNVEALFNDIVFTIDLTGVDCHEAGYSHLCVTLDSSLACAESWCQSPEAVDTMCTPIFCSSNVELNVDSVVVTVPLDAVITDGILQELTFDLDFTPSPGSAAPVNSAGLDRYEVIGFLSEDQFGTVKVATAIAVLTPAQDSMDITDSVTSTFVALEVTLDLTGVSCAGGIYTHFCAELEPSLEASKVWKQSDDAIKIGCFPICCAESIDINIDTLTIDWPTSLIIHDGGIANVFLCIFLSTTEGADVINAISTDLERYEITTWLSIDAQGNGPVATTKGNILKKFQVQPLINGEQFMMAEVDVEFDLKYIDCHETHIWDVCIDIQPADPSRCLWAQLPTAINTICTPIYCVPNVELNVNQLVVGVPDYLVGGGVTSVTFDLKFTPSPGSSPAVNSAGNDRYLVVVYLAQNLHGDYPTAFGEAVLSVAQKQLDITDNIQSVFTQLTVDLDLTSVDCSTAKYKYVCANLLPSTAAKNKWAQSSDAIITACTSVPCVSCHYVYETVGNGNWDFVFGHLQVNYITFAVQAHSYVHIGLSAENNYLPYMYEIIFGGYDNSMILLRRQQGGEFVASAAVSGVLSAQDYRTFWIVWHHGTILVGLGGSYEAILTYTDPDPLWIKYLGFTTSYNIIGYWQFCNVEYGGLPPLFSYPQLSDCDAYTPGYSVGADPYQYIWNLGLLESHTVHFEVYATSTVYLAFSAENHNLPDMYEIIIGAAYGMQITIARCQGCDPVAYAVHPWILNYYSYTSFYVTIGADGTITISYSSSQHILLTWHDPTPLPVSYCGYCTGGLHNYGLWKFCHV
ncbi:extracellular matrix protein A-like [Asterias rubens]|uniref:extracellular matrix protein A-like n=1 Tax=Asterias rubens TaxID=7604 RepID=UPI001455B0B5|nr:extracellular matrix protein A-like [Asterias rubens]